MRNKTRTERTQNMLHARNTDRKHFERWALTHKKNKIWWVPRLMIQIHLEKNGENPQISKISFSFKKMWAGKMV